LGFSLYNILYYDGEQSIIRRFNNTFSRTTARPTNFGNVADQNVSAAMIIILLEITLRAYQLRDIGLEIHPQSLAEGLQTDFSLRLAPMLNAIRKLLGLRSAARAVHCAYIPYHRNTSSVSGMHVVYAVLNSPTACLSSFLRPSHLSHDHQSLRLDRDFATCHKLSVRPLMRLRKEQQEC
jgi:hypothetical protein